MKAPKYLICALLGLSRTTYAGSAIVFNGCSGNIEVFSFDPSGAQIGDDIIVTGQSLSYAYGNGGSQEIHPPNSAAWVNFDTTSSDGTVFYNTATNGNSNPFPGGFKVSSSDGTCPSLDCPDGQTGCLDSVGGISQNQVKTCSSAASLTFSACQG